MGPRNYTKGSRSYKQMDGLSYKIKMYGRSKIFDSEALKLLVRRSFTVEVESGRRERWRPGARGALAADPGRNGAENKPGPDQNKRVDGLF